MNLEKVQNAEKLELCKKYYYGKKNSALNFMNSNLHYYWLLL